MNANLNEEGDFAVETDFPTQRNKKETMKQRPDVSAEFPDECKKKVFFCIHIWMQTVLY